MGVATVIDAPESAQLCQRSDGARWRCGQQAALALQDLIGRRPVTCVKRDTDRYGRLVGQCAVEGADINAWLVTNGRAAAYRRHAMDYVDEEQGARAAAVGIWSGAFVMPWDWRRGERLDAAREESADRCRIKGNVSQRGERIYHVPGGRYYDRTRIDASKGERWFCTEAAGRAQHWTRAVTILNTGRVRSEQKRSTVQVHKSVTLAARHLFGRIIAAWPAALSRLD